MLVPGNGSQITPPVALFDFSGFKGVPPPLPARIAIVALQSLVPSPGTCTPPGQRTGSIMPPVNAATEPFVSAAFGARKPSAYVARTASVLIGVHFAPTLGVVESPPPLE